MPAFRFGEAQQGAEAQEIGFRFGDLEGGMFITTADEGGALFEAFADAHAERGILAGERTRFEVRRAQFELPADACDETFGQHLNGIQ